MLYVDEIQHDSDRKGLADACHLISDTSLTELHAMAERLGLKQEWFHLRDFPHYLLSPNKRTQALRFDVQVTTNLELVRLAQRIRLCAVVTKRPCERQARQRCHNPACDYPGGRPICRRHSYLVIPVWGLGRKPEPVCLRCVRHPELRAARAQVLGRLW
jgi:hypothetical protein